MLALSAAAPGLAQDIPSIRASSEDDAIHLEVVHSDDEAAFVLFRALEPLTSQVQLDEATEVARLSPGERSFVDTAPAGLPWYYAVFSKSELEADEPRFVAGENVTDEPERIQRSEEPASIDTADETPRSHRSRPLPRLNPDHSAITGEPLPPSALPHVRRRPIDGETEAAIERLLERAPTGERRRPEPAVLDHGEAAERSENEQTLRQIVRATVEPERWDNAVDYLGSFLARSLSRSEERMVFFYLGQAHYYRDEYRRAILYLLQANDDHYAESRPFIDAALIALAAG